MNNHGWEEVSRNETHELAATTHASPSADRPKPTPQPWVIPLGAATCALCGAGCEVRSTIDLFTAEDDKDYALCSDCWSIAGKVESDAWDQATSDAILRKTTTDDRAVAALMVNRDARVARPRASSSDRCRALAKRFSGRPGIDDAGGGSGPGWED